MDNSSMYANIASKIKTSAKVVCVLGIIASIIFAIYFFVQAGSESDSIMGELVNDSLNGSLIILGFICLIGGPIFFVIKSFLIYGLGELIELTENKSVSRVKENTTDTNHTDDSFSDELEQVYAINNNETIYCAECGAVVQESTKYCPVCNIKLD